MPQPLEHCTICDNPTGKAGRGDGSLYCEDCGAGPFCNSCFERHEQDRARGVSPIPITPPKTHAGKTILQQLQHVGQHQAGCLTTNDGVTWHPANLCLPAANQLEMAWVIIANAYGGDWEKASPDWREAAQRWRAVYHWQMGDSEIPDQPACCGRDDNQDLAAH